MNWHLEFRQQNGVPTFLRQIEDNGYHTTPNIVLAKRMTLETARRLYLDAQSKGHDCRVVESSSGYVLETCDYKTAPSPPPEEFYVFRDVAPKKTSDGSSFIYSFPGEWASMYQPVRGETCKEVLDKIFGGTTYQAFVDSLPLDPSELEDLEKEKAAEEARKKRLGPSGAILRPGSRTDWTV